MALFLIEFYFFIQNWPSHVLDNPLCQDGAYQSPENVEKYKKRKSGVNIGLCNLC